MNNVTPARLAALRLVEDGQLEWSKSMGTWEPKIGTRLVAFTWLADHELIEPDYDAEPVGRVMHRVPVLVTDRGRAILEAVR